MKQNAMTEDVASSLNETPSETSPSTGTLSPSN